MQTELLQQIDTITLRVLQYAMAQGLLDDETTKRMRMGAPPPYRMFQALLLTSDAFMGLTEQDAADTMGVSLQAVKNYLQNLKQKYPHVAQFQELWGPHDMAGSLHRPLDISHIDETKIAHVF